MTTNKRALQLTKMKVLNPMFPNKSTGLVNGKCSGILNWNDIAYPSFYRAYKDMIENYWIASEVSMSEDANDYLELSESEKNAYDQIIGLLASLDGPQTKFMAQLSAYITDTAAQTVLAVIGQQEAVHNESYSYTLASISSVDNQKKVFENAKTNEIILKRNKPIMDAYDDFIENPTGETIVKALVQSSILEGINFYSGFAYFYNLSRHKKMTNTAKIISFINR